MEDMFNGATDFDQDISLWNTSKVNTMKNMFRDAENFNNNITNWTVLNSTDLSNMFFNATSMIDIYGDEPGFGSTPTTAFFNK